MTPDLPPPAAAALERALSIGIADYAARAEVAEAFAAVGWPSPAPAVMPRPDELTSAQRALVAALAAQPTVNLAFIKIANVRLAQWIGLAPPTILERIVPDRGAPLWRVVRELEEARDPDALRRFLSTLSIADRLEAFGEVNAFGHEKPYRLKAGTFFDYCDRDLLAELRDEGMAWAPRFADRLLTHDRIPGEEIRWPLFLALVRARVPIEPRWDALLPLGFGVYRDLTDEVVAAIPAERRDAAIVGALGKVNPSAIGLPLLEKFPSAALARALLGARGEPSPSVVAELRRIGETHAVVAEVLASALAGAPPPVALSTARVLQPTSASELSAIEQAQLAKAGEGWDGNAATAAERLAADDAETSFAGHVELRALVGSDGAPAYDAWLYMVDSGTIFVAGTERVAAEIIQGGLECSDRALRDGLAAVLLDRRPAKRTAATRRTPSKPASTASSSTTSTTAKPAAKKPAAKKPTTKKPAAKKPTTKKPPARKRR